MMKGLLIAEHLGGLLVILMAVAWIAGIMSYEHGVIRPLREEASAYHAANVALITKAKSVLVGGRRWQVVVTPAAIEVMSGDAEFRFTPRRDAD